MSCGIIVQSFDKILLEEIWSIVVDTFKDNSYNMHIITCLAPPFNHFYGICKNLADM